MMILPHGLQAWAVLAISQSSTSVGVVAEEEGHRFAVNPSQRHQKGPATAFQSKKRFTSANPCFTLEGSFSVGKASVLKNWFKVTT